jgi:hypothetical protein
LLLLSVSYGLGHNIMHVSPDNGTPLRKYQYLAQPFWAWSLSCAKISVALCLLRIQRGVATWRMFLYCLIILQVVISTVISYFQLSLCKPLESAWDFNVAGSCMDMVTAQTSIYVTLAMQIFTDMTYSLLPLSLLTDRRPSHEKVAICSIILTGLAATSASIYKTTLVKNFNFEGMIFLAQYLQAIPRPS